MFRPEGAKVAPSLGEKSRVTPITEYEVAVGYPCIKLLPYEEEIAALLLGTPIVFAALAICASMQGRATPERRGSPGSGLRAQSQAVEPGRHPPDKRSDRHSAGDRAVNAAASRTERGALVSPDVPT